MLELSPKPIEHPWFAPGQPPMILGVGRLITLKNFSMLMCAFAQVRQHREVRLIILGEGEERPRLEALVAKLGLEEDVDMPGFVSNPYAYMRRAAVFVLSSWGEGFGNVLVEAMACETPVVSTNCPNGPGKILEHGHHGRLVPIGSATALADAIADQLDNPYYKTAARRAQAFTLEALLPQYCNLLGLKYNAKIWVPLSPTAVS